MRSIFCIIIYVIIANTLFAQKETTYWYFDQFYGLSFASGNPIFLSDGRINTAEGCAVISDKKTGELLFYTDGVIVRNRFHEIMPNGTGLKGGLSSTQSAVIVPKPASDKEFYIFTAPDLTGNDGNTFLHYSKVSLHTLQGSIVEKNIKLIDSVGEKLTGTLHCNPYEYWIITHHRKKAIFYAFHVTKHGIDTVPVISDFGDSYISSVAGYLKISPNGKQIATGVGVLESKSELYLFDFDKISGKVTNRRKIDEGNASSFYGISFSPNNRFLYANNNGALQYDLSSNDPQRITDSKTTISQLGHGAFQIGLDKKIYVPMGQSLGIIQKPNNKGNLCDVKEEGVKISCRAGLPNFMDYLFNETDDSLCSSYPGILIGDSACINEQLIITHKDARNFLERTWYIDNGEIVSINDSTLICKFTKAGTYRVRLIVRSEYINDTVVKNVFIIDKPKAIAGKDTVLCSGTSNIVQIGYPSIEGYRYMWNPETGLSNPRISNPLATLTKNTTYILTVANSLNCIAYDTISITLRQAPKIEVSTLSGDTTLCRGDTIQLIASGAESFEWSPKEGLNDPFIPNPIASPTKSTLYTVIGRNGECSDTGSVLVSVFKKPILKLLHQSQLCSGDSITLAVSGAEHYDWFPKDSILFSSSAYPIVFPKTTTTYYVKGTTSTCSVLDSITITVFQKPKLSISDSENICLGSSVTLKAEGADSYHWLPHTGLNNPFSATPIATPLVSTAYTVYGTSQNCTDSAIVKVTVRDTTQFPFILSILGKNPFTVGTLIPILVHTPSGVDSFMFSISFESSCLYYKGSSGNTVNGFNIIESGNGLLHVSSNKSEQKENTILLYFILLLPPERQLHSAIRIENITIPEVCSRGLNNEIIIEYEPSCAWSLRGVESFNSYNVTISNNKIILNTGIGGYTRLTIYDLKGNKLWEVSQTTLPDSLIEYEIPQLPTGTYLLQTQNFDYKGNLIFVNE